MNFVLSRGALRSIRASVSVGAVIIAAYFIALSLADNWSEIKARGLHFNGYSALAIILFILAVVVSGILWGQILSRLSGRKVAVAEAVRVNIGSWLLKYIPGQVGSYAGKVVWGSRSGFSKKDVTISFIYENILLISTSVLITVPILTFVFLDRINSQLALFLPLLLAVPITLLSIRPIFYRFVRAVLKILKKPAIDGQYFLGGQELLVFNFKYLVPRVFNAAGFVLIAQTATPVSPSQYLGLGATYVLAGIIGILVLFVPSGLGVREAVITLFLTAYYPLSVTVLIAILSRFYATIADILLAIIYYGLAKRRTT